MALDAVEAICQLQDRSSAKRRSAAKRLRKLGNSDAGAARLEALKNEVRDSRTWETQYQMTMALGTCGSPSDLPYLRDVAHPAGLDPNHRLARARIGDQDGLDGDGLALRPCHNSTYVLRHCAVLSSGAGE